MGQGKRTGDMMKKYGKYRGEFYHISESQKNIDDAYPQHANTASQQLHNTMQSSIYAVDIASKTFDNQKIQLKEVQYPGYTPQHVIDFFACLDCTDTVTIYATVYNCRPYLNEHSLIKVDAPVSHQGQKKSITILPKQLLWLCLPPVIRDEFKKYEDHLLIFKRLFEHYGKKVIVRS